MSNWSDWVPIEIAKSKTGPFNYLGIYQIGAVMPTGKPIPIHRLVGVDRSGVLYIGRSGHALRRSIANRIGEFDDGKRHSGGATYARAKQVLDKVFPGHRLQVKAMRVTAQEAIEGAESRALEYFEEHAELPPCNSARSNAWKR